MPLLHRYNLPIAAGRLEFLFERLRLIDRQQEKLLCNLADEGIIVSCRLSRLRIETSDPEAVARLKEQLIRIDREKSSIVSELSSFGGRLLTDDSYEALFPGGPAGGYISWQPGEREALFYRETAEPPSERCWLPEASTPRKTQFH